MKNTTKLQALAVAASFVAVVASANPTGYIASTTYGADTFYLYAGYGNSWATDEGLANAAGGYLAILPNQATITAVYGGLINNGVAGNFFTSAGGQDGEAYIGAIPADGTENVGTNPNDWSWVTSTPANLYGGGSVPSVVPFTVGSNFNSGEPNGDSEGLAINRYGTSTFNDEGGHTGGYIVEFGPVPTPDGAMTASLLGGALVTLAAFRRKFVG